jgi:hypothetical protein
MHVKMYYSAASSFHHMSVHGTDQDGLRLGTGKFSVSLILPAQLRSSANHRCFLLASTNPNATLAIKRLLQVQPQNLQEPPRVKLQTSRTQQPSRTQHKERVVVSGVIAQAANVVKPVFSVLPRVFITRNVSSHLTQLLHLPQQPLLPLPHLLQPPLPQLLHLLLLQRQLQLQRLLQRKLLLHNRNLAVLNGIVAM